MSIQLNKILIAIVLLSSVFISHSGQTTSVGNEWKDIQESIQDFVSSFSIKDTMDNMNPAVIIGVCIAIVLLAIVFRSLIIFIIIFSILWMMFGSTEKAMNYLKEKFNFIKSIDLKSSTLKQEKNKTKD